MSFAKVTTLNSGWTYHLGESSDVEAEEIQPEALAEEAHRHAVPSIC